RGVVLRAPAVPPVVPDRRPGTPHGGCGRGGRPRRPAHRPAPPRVPVLAGLLGPGRRRRLTREPRAPARTGSVRDPHQIANGALSGEREGQRETAARAKSTRWSTSCGDGAS